MEPDGDTPPFWSQPSTTVLLSRRRLSQPSPLLNPVVLILAVPILTLLILFFILPPFLSHTNQILRPNSVKKGWDSLNVVLVLLAVLCGVFARWSDDVPSSDADRETSDIAVSSFVNRPRRSVTSWLDFPDQKEYNKISSNVDRGGGGGLRRSSSSYPDLRQESLWQTGGGNRSRFSDDFEVNFNRSPPPEDLHRRGRRSLEAEREEAETIVKEIPVDKVEVCSAAPPRSPASPPPPPPPTTATLKRRRSSQSVPHKKNIERKRNEAEFSENQQPAPPPPEEKRETFRKKKSGTTTTTTTTKEIATAITSLYKGQRKRKKKVKSRDIYDSATQASSPPEIREPQATPPPPPPPPSKVLQNLFKKTSKNKRIHSVPTTAPPPPPPPPPNSIFNNIFKTGSKSKRFQQSSTAPPPPPPPPPPSSILNSLFKNGIKSRRFKNVTTTTPLAPPPPPEPPRRHHINTGKPPKPIKPNPQYHEKVIIAPPSPLIPIPPPPPPPPFRMPEAKFVAQGDFVRILSAHSSRCSSPELEDVDVISVKSEHGDSSGPSITCPSPDVNVKADTFIARLRDEWRLEKMKSVREKRNLG